MMLRNVLRGMLAVSVVLGLVGVAAAANAVPAPASGPVAGGTEITIEPPPGVTFTQVSAGDWHTVALATDGAVYAWGRNDDGQLGDGLTARSRVPVRVQTPAGVTFTQVNAGGSHSVALAEDGTAYAWGNNSYGRLGDGTTTGSSVPVRVEMPPGVAFTQVSAGGSFSVALAEGGAAYSWGLNVDGRLGNGSTDDSSVPVPVQMPPGVTFTQVGTGYWHSVALAANGDVYAWGDNDNGQLGDDTTTNRGEPVRVRKPDGVTFTQVAADSLHSIALTSDGTAYAWGGNSAGQLGDGSTINSSGAVPRPVRVQIPAELTFTQVTAGHLFSVAAAADGSAYAWGYNLYGQMGNSTNEGTSEPVPLPVRVQMPAGVRLTQLSSGYAHTAALASDGTVYSWGNNWHFQLGGGTYSNMSVPLPVLTHTAVTGASFGGIEATDVVENGDGSWTAITPPHAPGPVDVVVSWSRNGVAQPDITHEGAFTYVVAPTVSDPLDQAVTAGDTAVFVVDATGTPEPNLWWELSADGGNTWSTVGATDGMVSGDGKTLSIVATETLSGVLYRVTAESSEGEVTSAAAMLTVSAAPVAPTVSDPLDQAVTAGDDATFTVDADGTPTPVITWEFSADDGATWSAVTAADGTVSGDGKTLTVTATEALSGTQYRAIAENSVGVVTSEAALLTVSAAPVAPTVTDPADQSVTAGDAATFMVETTSTPVPSLLWEFSTDDGSTWSAVGAAHGTASDDGKTLTVTATEALSGTQYRAIAENSVGVVTSNAATLTVTAAPVAPTVTDPADQEVTAGDTATFTVDTTGAPEPSLLWEYSTDDGSTWSAVTAADGTVSGDGKTLTVAATEALSGTQYRVTAENTVSAVTSAAATLTVSAAPVAPTVTDPADQEVTAGDTATFTVDTTGAPEPSLLWEYSTDDGSTWSAVTAADGTVSDDGKTLTVTATEALSGFQYRATAENTVGVVTSAAATLTVTAVPVAPPVTDAVGEKDLARTGSDPVPAIAVAVLIALVGAGLVLASRRKQA